MGSGDWFKTVLSLRKVKYNSSKQVKKSSSSAKSSALKWKNTPRKNSRDLPVEDVAATRIQTAFRAYMARKRLLRLKRVMRLKTLSQGSSVKNQSSSTLSYLHSWGKIQFQIRERRLYMVTEGRTKQKKLENQRKLEAKLHEVEVEWCGGSETMDAILARIHDREDAAVKRERAMAYAFSHQWRANSNPLQWLGKDELGKSNWGWSWKERWIAARPWESRVVSPKKALSRQCSKSGKKKYSLSPKTPVLVKSLSPNGKATTKAKRLFYPASEKPATLEGGEKVEEIVS